MALPDFSLLSTEKFRKHMRPYAEEIYKRIWPGCQVKDLREHGVAVHILDKNFGIDTLTEFPSGQWISIQEKYRNYRVLLRGDLKVNPPYPDFTQEYINAEGTKYESPGEWFNLGAQIYFYGWANEIETDFAAWLLMDIAKYKLLIEDIGGLATVGRYYKNRTYGRASFYAIPIYKLEPAIIYCQGLKPFCDWKDNIRSGTFKTTHMKEFAKPEVNLIAQMKWTTKILNK